MKTTMPPRIVDLNTVHRPWPAIALFVAKCIGGALLIGAALGLIAVALTVMSGWPR